MRQEAGSRKIKIKKGDKVKIIAGRDVGKEGEVEKVISAKNKIVVTEINLVKKHLKRQREGEKGGIVTVASPVDVSNVMLICPKCSKPARVRYEYASAGKKTRVCKRCGKEIG